VLGQFKHSITKHDYTVEVWAATVVRAPRGFQWIARGELERLPLSTMARKGLGAAGVPEQADADNSHTVS
jgi:hypothetical protein